jgi:hypothetical protein
MEATRKRGSSVESQLNSKNAGTYVDSNPLLPKSARSADAVYIIFTISAYEVWVNKVQVIHSKVPEKHVRGDIVVDNE